MERNDAIARGEKAFDAEYVMAFHRRVDECLEKGRAENKAEPEIYGADFERKTKPSRKYTELTLNGP